MVDRPRATAVQQVSVRRERCARVRVAGPGREESLYTVRPHPGESALDLVQRTRRLVAEDGATPLSMELFGGFPERGASDAHDAAVDCAGAPVTWVAEERRPTGPVVGLQAWAVAGRPVTQVRVGSALVGAMFEDDAARYCRLGGLLPSAPDADPSAQTHEVYELMGSGLAEAGLSPSSIVRTWYYNRDMLAWYEGFNAVRHERFARWGLLDGIVPASTGVGGANPRFAALQAGLLAVAPRGADASVHPVSSPLQCPPIEYGSAFGRATELSLPGHRRLYVSGTASIAPNGDTVGVGDLAAQVGLTMEVVHAVLRARNMDWGDVVRALVYVRRPEDAGVCTSCLRVGGVPSFPFLTVCNSICRDDLLFEIELDAFHADPASR